MPSSRARLPRPTVTLLAAFALLAIPAGAHAATVAVDDGAVGGVGCGTVGAPCATLAEGIAAANAGDTVTLAPGRYAGAAITKPLTIAGPDAGTSGQVRALGAAGRSANITSTIEVPAGAGSTRRSENTTVRVWPFACTRTS